MSTCASFVDRIWFNVNPSRDYRVRLAFPYELVGWPVPPKPGFTCKVIVRRHDLALFAFATADEIAIDDYDDEEIASNFGEELDRAAAGGAA